MALNTRAIADGRQRGSRPADEVAYRRWRWRLRQLRLAQTQGAWLTRVVAGAVDAPSARAVAGIVAAGIDLPGRGYPLTPTSLTGNLATALATTAPHDIAREHERDWQLPDPAAGIVPSSVVAELVRPPRTELPGVRLVAPPSTSPRNTPTIPTTPPTHTTRRESRGCEWVTCSTSTESPPAGLDPLRPVPGFDLRTHLDLVRALFLAAFDAQEPFPQVLALGVRLASLRMGTTGQFLEGGHQLDIDRLLRHNVVLEIEDVGDDQAKAFLMGTVLLSLIEQLRVRARQHPDRQNTGVRHLTVFEEAHRLLRAPDPVAGGSTSGHAVRMIAGLLAEIRAYGEGVIVAEQIPSHLINDVVKNTAVKILHRLPAADDRDTVGATMNLSKDQSQYVVTLPPGQAAAFADGFDQPVLIRVPEPGDCESHSTAVTGPEPITERESGRCRAELDLRDHTARRISTARRLLVQHVYVERHKVDGHDLHRHDSGRDDQAQATRVEQRRDPAFTTDSHEYQTGTDRFKQGDGDPNYSNTKEHTCGTSATRIADPVAWATTVAAVHEHPTVRAMINAPHKGGRAEVDLRIEDVLGPEGHQACSGSRLSLEDFSTEYEAWTNARDWTRAHRQELAKGVSNWEEATQRVHANPDHARLVEPRSEAIALTPADQGPFLRAIKPDLALVIAGATERMPTGGLPHHVFRAPRGNQGIAHALWYDLFPDDPIPGEEDHGRAGNRPDLWTTDVP